MLPVQQILKCRIVMVVKKSLFQQINKVIPSHLIICTLAVLPYASRYGKLFIKMTVLSMICLMTNHIS